MKPELWVVVYQTLFEISVFKVAWYTCYDPEATSGEWNEITMKEKQWKAFPFRFCETSYIFTDTKGVYKQRYYQEIFKIRVSNFYLL